MIKEKIKGQASLIKGQFSAKREEKKENKKMREKQEETKRNKKENKRKPRIKAKNKESVYLSWVSSHIQGKSMKLGCSSIMFNASFACYDELWQGLWVIKAW